MRCGIVVVIALVALCVSFSTVDAAATKDSDKKACVMCTVLQCSKDKSDCGCCNCKCVGVQEEGSGEEEDDETDDGKGTVSDSRFGGNALLQEAMGSWLRDVQWSNIFNTMTNIGSTLHLIVRSFFEEEIPVVIQDVSDKLPEAGKS